MSPIDIRTGRALGYEQRLGKSATDSNRGSLRPDHEPAHRHSPPRTQIRLPSYVPSQVISLLDSLVAELPAVIGANLVGIYLYGSLTQRAFNPKRSDLDCIVVTRRALSAAQFSRLRACLAHSAKSNSWTARLQISVLIRDRVLTPNSSACLYQFGKLSRTKSDGNPIIWMNVLASKLVLFGPNPRTFLPPITRAILLRALDREVGYLREELMENPRSKWRDVPFYRAYAVLTVCRILYSHASATVVSKPRAARWAMRRLPREFRTLVEQAIAHDAGRRRVRIELAPIRRFVEFAAAQLLSARC